MTKQGSEASSACERLERDTKLEETGGRGQARLKSSQCSGIGACLVGLGSYEETKVARVE